jgi:hypothetical protein
MTAAKNGIVEIPSHHPVDETVERLKSILSAKRAGVPDDLLANISVAAALAAKAAE